MPGSANGKDTVCDFISSFDQRDPLFDGFEILLGLGNDASKTFWELPGNIRRHPEIPLGRADVIGGIRIVELSRVIEHAPKVIRMSMGENHLRDRSGIEPLARRFSSKRPSVG